MIGIVGAMEEEIISLKNEVENFSVENIAGIDFFIGNLFGKKIVLTKCGIGKVNAALCTTILINKFNVSKIVFIGVAGAVNKELKVGDIVISQDLIEHDFDTTIFGEEFGQIPRMKEWRFRADKNLIDLASCVCNKNNLNFVIGRILSGDQFVNSSEKVEWFRKQFAGDAVEMEGAALAHVCCLFNIPFVVIRSISDNADNSSHVDFKEFCLLAAENSKKIICGLLEKI